MNTLKYFDNLNLDLQYLILSMIRYPISNELNADIINFKIFKDKMIDKYLKKGYDYNIDGAFYIYYQIENDLIGFFNDDIATMDYITENNFQKLKRILSIKNKLIKNKEKIINNLMHGNDSLRVNSRINILIGALTNEERFKFLELLDVD